LPEVALKIIATADVHLGMKFANIDSNRADLADERFRALERVVEAGNRYDADLLVVAGDLFHRVGVAAKIVEQAAAILDAFAGAAVAVLPGNHDYLAPEGDRLWSRFRESAGDRTLVLDRAGPFDLAPFDLPATILAAPCDSQHSATHRLAWTSGFVVPEGRRSIGVAHGSIDGLTLDSEGRYFPMDRRFLSSLPADLWIVGHTHRHHDVRGDRLVVPGTPEADGFDCPVLGGAALIDVSSSGGYRVELLPTGRYRFVEATLVLDDPDATLAQTELEERAAAAVPEGDVLVRLSVTGRIADESFALWNEARERLLSDPRVTRVDDDGLARLLTKSDVDRRYAAGSFAHRLLTRLVAAGDHDAISEALTIVEEMRR
jgi:DNA repair exonuclease SbcCD nuclease subunit